VLALEIPHKGGRTFGYRISDGTSVLAYLSDHWPTKLGPGPDGLGEYHEAARRLTEAADVVFHDAQYRDEELPTKGSFGHSSTGYAVALATIAQAKRVVFFHHDPSRTDAEVASIASAYRHAPLPVEAAREGSTIDLA